jgi:hypothetical protein
MELYSLVVSLAAVVLIAVTAYGRKCFWAAGFTASTSELSDGVPWPPWQCSCGVALKTKAKSLARVDQREHCVARF